MNREEAAIFLKAELAMMTFTEETKDRIQAIDMAVEALKQEPTIVRCKECKHRYDFECPMYDEEWFTIDEGDDFCDSDFRVIDSTQDNGFCYMGQIERSINNDE